MHICCKIMQAQALQSSSGTRFKNEEGAKVIAGGLASQKVWTEASMWNLLSLLM